MSNRTECRCRLCQVGCKTMPGYLAPDDLYQIPLDKVCASDGALVIHQGVPMRIPTIVPKQKSNGECVFFENGLCSIHDHSPYGCRSVSACQPDTQRQRDESNLVLFSIVQKIASGGLYWVLSQLLPRAKPLRERRQAFEVLFKTEQRKARKSEAAYERDRNRKRKAVQS